MKGAVFTEFLELVEQRFGYGMVDRVLNRGCPFHGGYTSVGTYDHHQLIDMIVELSSATSTPPKELVKGFGEHLFGRFLEHYPEAFGSINSTFELLKNVESAIHVEVRKLSPDAELPHFKFPDCEEGRMEVIYYSNRPFADLAEGMIQACIVHFGEPLTVTREDLPGVPGTNARFTLSPIGDPTCCSL